MLKGLDPCAVFRSAYQDRQTYPLRLPGNPYKLAEARSKVADALNTARAALVRERHPVRGGGWDTMGNCLAFERRRWARKLLAEGIAQVLGYDALPGLEVMARPDLSTRFSHVVCNSILPAAAEGLLLPRGEPMMVHLLDVLERTLALIDETLVACEVAHA